MLICETGDFGLGGCRLDEAIEMDFWERNDGLPDWRIGVGRFTQSLYMVVT